MLAALVDEGPVTIVMISTGEAVADFVSSRR
jgi:hypothetical protein